MPRYAAACLLSATCLAWPASAVTLKLCTDETGRMPMIGPNGSGAIDLLVREAAREVGVQLEVHNAPATRCREELKHNVMQGFPAAPFAPSIADFLVFPMQAGGIDAARAAGASRVMVYRRVGTAVQWDGARWEGLRTPVIVPAGSVALLERLQAQNVAADDGAKTLAASFAKLLHGRGDAALGWEPSAMPMLAQAPYAGKLEALPSPFMELNYYLAVTRPFYEAHGPLVEKLWDAMARIRRTPAYQLQARRIAESWQRQSGN